jgi:DNA-binding CsgD family transcriptional regulator
VVDDSLGIVGSNTEALQILTFPDRPEKIQRLDSWLSNKIRTNLVERRSPLRVVGEFRSAKRTYLCRSFPLAFAGTQISGVHINGHSGNGDHSNGNHTNGNSSPGGLLIVMLERKSNEAVTIAELSERFNLTAREQETVKFLLEGLTSKEIAERMNISPNTVKAFIRLVMVKMNVSTRSGIIGKIVGWKAGHGLETGSSSGSSPD